MDAKLKIHLGLIHDEKVFLNNLIWLGPPPDWLPDEGQPPSRGIQTIYRNIAPDGENRSVKAVAERIQKYYPGDTPEKMLESLKEEEEKCFNNGGFFAGCWGLNSQFCFHKMGPLWVRSIRDYDHDKKPCGDSWEDKLYIDDGSHRALVYALRVICGASKFNYVPVLWSKSWKPYLGWGEPICSSKQDAPPHSTGWTFIPVQKGDGLGSD